MDGIDFDLEWGYVNEKYSFFVLELCDFVDVYGFMFIVVLFGIYCYFDILDEVLAVYDWINMMVYDLIGFWDFGNFGLYFLYFFVFNVMFYW